MKLERHIGSFGCYALWSFAVSAAALVGIRSVTDGLAGMSDAAVTALFLSVVLLALLSIAGWTSPSHAAWRPLFVVASVGSIFAALALDTGIARVEAAMGWRAWLMLGFAAAIEIALILYGYVAQRRLKLRSLGAGE